VSIIRRAARYQRFTILDNDVIEDEELSFRALGLLTFILSKPDHWTIDAEQLCKTHAEGRDAVRNALTHLEDAGYIIRRKVQLSDGTWSTETVVFDRPHDRVIGEIMTTGSGKPAVGKPAVGFSGANVSTDSKVLIASTPRTSARAARAPSKMASRTSEIDHDDEAPALGAAPRRESSAVRKEREETSGSTAFGQVLRLKRSLEEQGFSTPVNERALTKQINNMKLDIGTVRSMVDIFLANPRRYLKGDEVPWIGFVRQREVLKADAVKSAPASSWADEPDPYAKHRKKAV
jgi:hypothetical protein